MNVRKNAEAVFLAAAVCATFTAYATAHVPTARAVAPVVASAVASTDNMQVVVVKAKRLSAEEKAQLN